MPERWRPARARLQRLRIRLTLLFMAASALGLAVLAEVVTIADSRLREDRLLADLHGRAQEAKSRLYEDYDTDRINTEAVVDEPRFTQAVPQVYAVDASHVSASGDYQVVFGPDEPWLGENNESLLGLAAASVEHSAPNDENWPSAHFDDAGHSYFAVAHPIWGAPDLPIGAAVVVSDASEDRSQHREMVTIVWAGSAVLVAASAAAGYWLAGRSIRPAASAIESQERFLADAAHELRTPVAAIQATAEAAQAGGQSAAEAVERIARLARRTGTLVDDLLTLARMDAGGMEMTRERLRLDQLVEAVVEDFDDVELDLQPVTVTGDHRLVSRAVRNLVDNAVRHGRGDDPLVSVSVKVRSNYLEVSDTGRGIDEATRSRLFDRFRSSVGSSGSGLGLAIVAWVVDAHNATIEVLPMSPRGTTFVVRFVE